VALSNVSRLPETSPLRRFVNDFLFRRRIAYQIQLLPALAVIVFAFIIPLALLFTLSLWRFDPMRMGPTAWTLESYLKFLTDPFYLQAGWRTIRLGFTVTLVSLAIGYPLAYAFARMPMRYKSVWMFVLLTPLFVSVVVRTFGWLVLLDRGGIVNRVLTMLGIIETPLPMMHNMFSVVVGLVNVQLVFMVMPIYASLVGMNLAHEEAAATLGATPLRVFTQVTLPLSLPGVMSGSLLVFALTASSYVQPSVLGGPAFFVMPTMLFSEFMHTLNWPFAAAIGYLLLLLTLVVSYLPLRLARRYGFIQGE
jgi:putative spermidine/putrescine transport system permease protein